MVYMWHHRRMNQLSSMHSYPISSIHPSSLSFTVPQLHHSLPHLIYPSGHSLPITNCVISLLFVLFHWIPPALLLLHTVLYCTAVLWYGVSLGVCVCDCMHLGYTYGITIRSSCASTCNGVRSHRVMHHHSSSSYILCMTHRLMVCAWHG